MMFTRKLKRGLEQEINQLANHLAKTKLSHSNANAAKFTRNNIPWNACGERFISSVQRSQLPESWDPGK